MSYTLTIAGSHGVVLDTYSHESLPMAARDATYRWEWRAYTSIVAITITSSESAEQARRRVVQS